MPAIYIDQSQVAEESLNSVDTDGDIIDAQGYVIPVFIPEDEAQAWLDLFDETSSTSPSAANSRIIARAVLEALKAVVP